VERNIKLISQEIETDSALQRVSKRTTELLRSGKKALLGYPPAAESTINGQAKISNAKKRRNDEDF